MTADSRAQRFDWVDVAKGICIVLVVMMHATYGVEKAAGSQTWLNAFIDWARPFRMPDFFLISGLFLASRIDRPWRAYLDTKVLHFAYFYVLWLTIQWTVRAPGMVAEDGIASTLAIYLVNFVDPSSTLWFIYLLAVFFVATKLLRDVPKGVVIAAAGLIHLLAPKTGAVIIDEFTSRFVFFYTGYALAPYVFDFAERLARWPSLVLVPALIVWAAANTLGVESGLAFTRGPNLVFSYVGIAAVIAMSVLLSGSVAGRALSYCGRNSIVVYLAFTLFMGPVRVVLLKATGGQGLEFIALASAAAGVIGALLLNRIVTETRFDFLFKRPEIFRLRTVAGQGSSPRTATAEV